MGKDTARRDTPQRKLVRTILKSCCDHPTAETIYNRLKPRYPELSLGTVYRNLAVLAETGQLRRVTLPGQPERYDDPRVFHGHFHCRRCGKITDLDVPATLPEHIALPGHVTEECQVSLCGLCPNCQEEPV